jgi:hypothetical protein
VSYILNDGSEPARRAPRRPLLVAGAAIGLCVVLVAAFLAGRQGGGADEQWVAPPVAPGPPLVTWTWVGPQPVPVSAVHGPAERRNGLAAGFSHDAMGAVLAAINISTRLAGLAGPAVYETTARLQCTGDIEATIATIRNQRSDSVPGSTIPTEIFYRITSGDPNADLVAISIAFQTPQSTGMGGYAELARTLQWIDSDWKLQVPPAPLRLITSVDDYTSLGGPDGS